MKIVNLRSEILHMVKDTLDRMNLYHYFTVLKDFKVIVALQKLPEDFVQTPLDKAGNNAYIIFKKFYVDTLIQEIANSSNFILSSDNELNLVDHHHKYYETLKLTLDEKCEKLLFFILD